MAGIKSMKGALTSLYEEQRAQVKGIKSRSLVNKARNEAKREMEEAQSDAPLHLLRLDGRAATLFRNDAHAYAQQQAEGLVPWAAHPEVLIDRYDVRSLLDIYVEPDPRVLRHRQRTTKEVELEDQVHFEAFRDLIRLRALRLGERQGISHAEQENVAIRAAARTAAVAALEAAKGPKGAKPLPSQGALFAGAGGSGANAVPAGAGAFAAVGFAYGGAVEGGGGGGEEEEEEGHESDEDSDDDVPATAEDADMDELAIKDFGVEDFSSMLRWAMREEAAEAAAQARRSRRNWSRKKARLRSKRIAGQGLDPSLYKKRAPGGAAGASSFLASIPERKPEELAQLYANRDSPEYEPQRGRSRSPSGRRASGAGGGSSSARPQAEYITSFGSGGQGGQGAHAAADAGGVRGARGEAQGPRDAVPGAADPAQEGPQLLPAAALRLHGVRADERGSVSGRDYSRAKAGAAKAAAAPTVVRAAPGAKETPQERLKRLMAAQLNRKIQADSLTAAQKQQAADAERRARQANEVAAQEAERRDADDARRRERARSRSRSRERRRSRSRDRHADRRRSRSRSRSRSRHYSRGSGGGGGGGYSSRDHDSRRRSRSRSQDRYRSSSRRSPSPVRRR